MATVALGWTRPIASVQREFNIDAPGIWQGAHIRELRHDLGLTQEDLALVIGVNRVSVSKWENGTYAEVTMESIRRLLDLLRENPDAFKVDI